MFWEKKVNKGQLVYQKNINKSNWKYVTGYKINDINLLYFSASATKQLGTKHVLKGFIYNHNKTINYLQVSLRKKECQTCAENHAFVNIREDLHQWGDVPWPGRNGVLKRSLSPPRSTDATQHQCTCKQVFLGFCGI